MSQAIDTIPSLVLHAAVRWPDRLAIIDRETTITFAELARHAGAAARGLMAVGLQKGDSAAIWVPNRWEWMVAAIGIQMAGGVLVPLNTRFKGREVGGIMRRAGATVLISAGTFLDIFYPDMLATEDMPALKHIVVMDGVVGADPRQLTWQDFVAGGSIVPETDLAARVHSITPDDLCDLMFTSGTTGQPKGAMFSHAKTVAAGRVTVQIGELTEQDRCATFGPFSHNAAYKAGWVPSLVCGCATVITTDLAADAVIELIASRRVTVMPGPPTVWQNILDSPKRASADLTSLRRISTGGTLVPVELIRRLKREIGPPVVATGYGLTECCGSAANTGPADDAETIAHTAGQAVPGTELRIAGPDGAQLAAGLPGEILVRNASVLLGYLDDPAATAEALDPDGWLHTGDVGVLDEAGHLRITDRLRDMFIVGGFNCYPAEIENLLAGLPGVSACAVIGVHDDRLGQVGRAFLIRSAGSTLSEAEVIAWCRTNMANYKVPRAVRFVDNLPMTASGKVMKAELRKLEA